MSAIPNINEVVAAATANASSQSNDASTDTGGCSDCQMCQKSPGLVILPVRYAAIAESQAHGIDGLVPITSGGNFGDGVLDKSMQKASYILRCMRLGYFYLHFPNGDADGVKWRKYRVTSDSNFVPLPIDDLAAPGIEKTVACQSSSDWQMARCVTISQPEKVTQAWLAFSDTDWDNTVRDQVAQNPSQRMQFLDPLSVSPRQRVSPTPRRFRQ
ncbi:toxin VasX [Cobetia marina]